MAHMLSPRMMCRDIFKNVGPQPLMPGGAGTTLEHVKDYPKIQAGTVTTADI